MNDALRWILVIVSAVLVWVGRPDAVTAQSMQQMLERFREQCRAKYAHLRPQGPEVVGAHVQKCVAELRDTEGRTIIVAQLQPLWENAERLLEAGQLQEAEAAANVAIAKATELTRPESPAVAAGYAMLGRVQTFQGRFREAEQLARKALPIVEADAGANSPRVARLCNLLAYSLINLARQAEAEDCLNRALAIQERDPGPQHPDTAQTLINLALLRLEQGSLAEAEKLALRSVAINEAALGPQKPVTIRALSMLGTILRRATRFAEAEETLKRALSMWDTAFHGQHYETAVTIRRLAEVYGDTGRYEEAAGMLERSLKTLQTMLGPEHRHTLMTVRELADVKIKKGENHAGEILVREAIPAAEKVLGPNHIELFSLHISLGIALQAQKQLSEAEEAYRNGLAVAERIGKESPFVCGALQALALLDAARDELDRAKSMLDRAVALCLQSVGPAHARTMGVLRRLAEINVRLNDPRKALEQLKQVAAAIEARRESSALVGGNRFNNDVVPMLRPVAASFAAAAWQLELADGQGKAKFADDGLLGAQLLTQSTAASAIAQMGARVAAKDDALGRLVREGQDLQQRWEAIDRQLTTGFGDGTGDASGRRELRAELERTDKQLSEIGRRIAAEFPEYAAFARPTSLRIEDIQRLIGANEALVAFLVEGAESYAWAITKASVRWAKLALSPKAIAEQVAALRCGLDQAAWEDNVGPCNALFKDAYRRGFGLLGKPLPFDLARAHELYLALFGEVESLIAGKKLLIVPSGALTTLPFHVLVTEQPGQAVPETAAGYFGVAWLAKRGAITVLPSVSSLKALRQVAKVSRATQPFLGFGNPLLTGPSGTDKSAWTRQRCTDPPHVTTEVASRSLQGEAPMFFRAGLADVALVRQQWPLPETADELCAVAQSTGAAPDAVYLGEKATEANIKTLSANGTLSKARVVHFATHGLLAGESGALFAAKAEPALVLTPPQTPTPTDDGLLTASEVAQLHLDSDWVVLSACNTASGGSGAGAGEALSGLARGFFYAGARALLVSHWAVNSRATVDLVVVTFDALKVEPKLGRAEALRRSMLALIASGGRNAHPATWAPFVVVGEGAT
jgi:CHAT domain-containing protein/tetratricopeptide (TPR) repeat protein